MKKNIYILAVVFMGAAVFILSAAALQASHRKVQLSHRLADEIIRFHVRANSDRKEDQELKLKVRDAVIGYLKPLLTGSTSIEQSRRIIAGNEFGIKATAHNVIVDSGYDYDINVYFENSHFPTRTYGDITLPAGVYEAYRIDIGAAEGRNWWCVLYPPLCFEDATHAVMSEESKDTLQKVLTKEEYDMITNNSPDAEAQNVTDIKIRFRIFKFLNKYMK